VDTYAVNVLGTVHVLEALRRHTRPCAAVMVTTDKCYENREWIHGYRETDTLGGHDPYSASKACAELAVDSYRRSFFRSHPVRIASVRAGNVIGGGDWARDRIVPDCVRALQAGSPIVVRNPRATRPWQHVLEPLSGYLWLAATLAAAPIAAPPAGTAPTAAGDGAGDLASAFNFGPGRDANRTVAELVAEILKHWPGSWEDRTDPAAVHEAGWLQLSIDKAHALLGWRPVWGFEETIKRTVEWYRRAARVASDPGAIGTLTREQISHYAEAARRVNLSWA
jgi:CDP-glucose 4,6-dehydratase